MMKSILDRVFAVKPWILLLLLTLSSFAVFSQVTISGRVTDAQGLELTGVSASLQNTTYGGATDQNGSYSFYANVKSGNYKIVFSGVGFKTVVNSITIVSGAPVTANATLQSDAMGLDEVVVTGTAAGTTRRQLGNYISTVKADQLTKAGAGNVLSALQGKTAGAQISQNSGDPAGGLSVRLRGISSINSSSEPLYIVDGIIVNNATNRVTNTQSGYDGGNFIGSVGQSRLVDINPADIERIEVLNGAAAAAIYGSRANAGVVQIFTKKGTAGAPSVSFSTSVNVSKLRKKLDVNQSPTKFGGSPDVFTQDVISTLGTPPTLPTNTTNVTRYDYQDYIFHTGLGTDNNVSVSGGTEKTKYYLSGSYFYNQGIIKNTDFRRYSFRANVEQTINKVLSVNMGLNYINSGGNEKPDGNSFYSPMNAVTIIGNFHDIQTRDALGNIRAVGERGRVNPVSVIEDFKQRQETNRVLANLGVKLKPFKGLSVDYTMGIDNYNQNGTTYMPAFAYNASTAFWGGGPTLDPTLNGYTSTANNVFFQINHDLNANYQINISDAIGSTTQVGYSVQYEKNRYSLLQGRGLASFIETVTGASTPLQSVDDRSELSISGLYLQENLRFWNRLFLTGAIRVDGSSVFGKDQRNLVYSKGSGSFIVSESQGWRDKLPWWNLFKLRAAYGESGNLTGISAYGRFNAYLPSSYLGRIALNSISQLANENVKPERQRELEIGTDMSFFGDRLGLQFNWYNKRVSDLLLNRLIAPTNGYSSFLNNFGALENKGFEVVLTGAPVRSKDFQWNVTAIYNHNRNKAVKIGQALTLLSTNAGAPVALLEGQPIGIFYGTFFALDASGQQVKNAAGLPQIEKGTQTSPIEYTTARDAAGIPVGTTLRKVIGDPNPDYTASLVNEINFKRFDLRLQLDAVQGNEVFNADFRTRQGVGSGKIAEQEQRGQLPRGWVNSVYQIEQWRISDGSFVKLRELSLGYNLGKLGGFSNLTFRMAGRNLFSWDNYNGYDPEMNAAGQSTILRGIDFGTVPIPRSFNFTVGAKF
jgi:TonB-linked SusC/RagA family outer membrane protein